MSTVVDLAVPDTRTFTIQGDAASDRAGWSVSDAGDVNGDGFDDIIIGAPYNDLGGTDSGTVYVVFGRAGGFGSLDLNNLSADNGFRVLGDRAFDHAGQSVSGAGDINGDGFDDIIVSAQLSSGGPFGYTGTGRSYVIFGKAGGFGTIDLEGLAPATGFTINGPTQFSYYSRFLVSVSGAGDINGDGFDDFVIGARYANLTKGAAYVVFGKASGFAPIDLSHLAPGDGFAILGVHDYDGVGTSVSSAGDVNGDHFDDLIIGAPGSNNGAGAAYVIFGKANGFGTVDLANLAPTAGFMIQGDPLVDRVGSSVSGAGDVNGDGFDDVIVGAPLHDDGGSIDAGAAYVIFGKAAGFGTVHLSSLGAGGFYIRGDDAVDFAGISVSGAGDINHDGFDDVIVGTDIGRAYVIFGRAGGFGAIDLTDLAPATGLVIQGAHPEDDLGRSVSGAGDFNGDGFSDLLLGAPRADIGGTDRGLVYLVSGTGPLAHVRNDFNGDGRSDILWRSETGLLFDWVATGTKGDGAFVSNAANFSTVLGADWKIAGTGDFNGDGISDILLRQDATGHLVDWLGNLSGAFRTNAQNFDSSVPSSVHVVGTGDFNGDGRDDILFRKDGGLLFNWLATENGGFASNTGNFSTIVGTEWQVAGTGDFNGDGIDDILWRQDATGHLLDWLGTANGGFNVNTTNFDSSVPTGLEAVGIGDFNGDGRDDILWQDHDHGLMFSWLATPTGGFSSNAGNFVTSGFALGGTSGGALTIGDYNGDGRDDILWQTGAVPENLAGQHLFRWIGTANGGFATETPYFLSDVPTNLHVQDPFL